MLIALLGAVVESLLAAALIAVTHVKQIYVLMPAQVVLYGLLLGTLAVIFRRYYGRPFWQSLRWSPGPLNAPLVGACGVAAAFAVMIASVLIHTPDTDNPMKALLQDPVSVVMLAVIGTTLAPLCEEVVFRGFLQPLLVRSLGAAPGILLTAAAFGLMHLQEYGYSWRHALLIAAAGGVVRLDAPAYRVDQGCRNDARGLQRRFLSAAGRAAGRFTWQVGGTLARSGKNLRTERKLLHPGNLG